jgi:hypothetical protein
MYKLIKSPSGFIQNLVQRQDGALIPSDPANTDYTTYLAWLEAGNTPDPAPIPVPPVPLTPAEKLAASGLTVTELKALLGLK